jgi:hypothetical protein
MSKTWRDRYCHGVLARILEPQLLPSRGYFQITNYHVTSSNARWGNLLIESSKYPFYPFQVFE